MSSQVDKILMGMMADYMILKELKTGDTGVDRAKASLAKRMLELVGSDEPAVPAIRPFGYKPPHSMQKVIKAKHRNKLRAEFRAAIKKEFDI